MQHTKNILCFGDSNTWGYEALTQLRFKYHQRWTGVLQKLLGIDYQIIEEGLNGRTTVHNESERPIRSAEDILPVLLESHAPLNGLIIMLGTNDLKLKFNSSAYEISQNLKQVCQLALNCQYNPNMKLIVVSPSHVAAMSDEDNAEFYGAIEKSKALAHHYQEITQELGVHFLDASKTVKTTTEDGIHWNVIQHRDFATVLSQLINRIY